VETGCRIFGTYYRSGFLLLISWQSIGLHFPATYALYTSDALSSLPLFWPFPSQSSLLRPLLLLRQQLQEFTDVSEKEKRFFRMWNRFLQRAQSDKGVVPLRALPDFCAQFVAEHSSSIRDRGLEEELTLHLANLWDEGHISRSHILDCMRVYRAP